MHNDLRAAHGVPPLQWDASLAAKAQAHSNTCKWGHSSGNDLGRARAGESIFANSLPPVVYRGMDPCSYATWALYLEVTSYDFANPGTSRDGVEIRHFTNIVWKATTKIGCGLARCQGNTDYVTCWFAPGYYLSIPSGAPGNATRRAFADNVPPTKCQTATRDPWCSACAGRRTTACFERPNYGQLMGREGIRLDEATKRCVSKCPPGVAPNCAACTAANRCIRCSQGYAFNARRKCVKARRQRRGA